MLKFFRKHARGWFMLAFMGIIIFVFVLYFGTDPGSRTARAIAVVDGVVISESEYYNEYAKMMDMVRARFGGTVSAEMIKQMDLKQATFDSLINRQVIIAKAGDLNVQVSEDELFTMITAMPDLQTNGAFDRRKYDQLLRYNKMTEDDFQAVQRINLAANKIEIILREGIKISDAEIFELYALQNQKMNLAFIEISPGAMRAANDPSDDDLEAFLKRNASAFLVPEQLKVKYLHFSADAHAPASLPEADIRDHYDRTKARYSNKDGALRPLESVRDAVVRESRQIKGKEAAYAAAKKAHDTIYQNENFDDYASELSLKIHSADFFPVNQPPSPLSDVADIEKHLSGLAKNDMSRVLQAEDGFYLIFVTDKKDAFVPNLQEIKPRVRSRYIEQERIRLAQQAAQDILAALRNGDSFEAVARTRGLRIDETGLFQPAGDIPKLGPNPEAVELILPLTPQNPYPEKPVNFNGRQVIFKLKDLTEPDIRDFEAKKDLYGRVLAKLKKEQAMKSWMEGNKEAMIKEKRLKIQRQVSDL
ncbi:MAG TPA: peptidylprolyl isomerase [Smithellaceae bacterium]|nr:peptidylprolyl isomerase [Smithellaceae bacterium]